jgi:hypothetical protein
MNSCKYCEELNTETEIMRIEEIFIQKAGYYGYKCPIKYCPACGKILGKYNN